MKNVKTNLTILALVLMGGACAHAATWDNGGAGNEYSTALNWSDNAVPSSGSTQDINGNHTVERLVNSTAGRTFVNGGATLNVTGGTHSDDVSGASRWNFIGSNSDGTVNQSAGTYNIGHGVRVGGNNANSDGTYNLTGGSLIISRGSNSAIEPTNPGGRPSLEVGGLTLGTGLFEISGGSFTTRAGVHIGGTGTFSVLGSVATSVGIGSHGDGDGLWIQKTGATLNVGVDPVGVTKILIDEVDGDGGQSVTFESDSRLDVDYYNGGTGGGTWTVMELENGDIVDNGLAFAPGVDTGTWSFNIDNSGVNGLLTVTATGTPVIVTNVTVDSIAELRQYAAQDNMTITMTPGTYTMNDGAGPIFLHFSGSNNVYNMSGVTIEMPTSELPGYGSSTEVNVLRISGDGSTVDGLTLTMVKDPNNGLIDAYDNPREYSADKGMTVVLVSGSDTTVKNCEFTTGGSYPYGYGDAFGKGARPNTDGVTDAAWIAHDKQSAFLITYGAGNVVVDNVILNMRSFGHGFFMQGGAHDILFRDCQVLGDTMADSDDIIAHPEYQEWGFATYKQPIPADIHVSKHEGAFRTYTNNDYENNGWNQYISNVTVTNCRIERMRAATPIHAEGYARIYDTEAYNCEYGFAVTSRGEAVIENCKGDALCGPLVYFQYSIVEPAIVDVELTGSAPGKGVWPIALIGGDDSRITITSSALPGVYPEGAYVNISQTWREWRHRPNGDPDSNNTGNYSDYATGNFISNLTDQALVFGTGATDNTGCVSSGGVINKGSGNQYAGTTLVPGTISFQDTWSYPPNPTNVPWAQYSGGELILPTPPVVIFDGTHMVDDADSLGGSAPGDGGTTVSNGTLEVAAGFALQGEDLVLYGTGTAGQGAVYSDGSPNNQTCLSSSSGTITLAGDAAIGAGIADNELLMGPMGGAGSLTKIGAGTLTLEGGANSFDGSVIISNGWIKARSNKVNNDLVIAAGAGLKQNENTAINQDAAESTVLDGTIDINGRSTSDAGAYSIHLGSLTGGASGLITSTSTAADQTVNINSTTEDSSFDGTVEGRVILVKNGAGTTLELNGTCSHTEGTFVNAGWLGGTGNISGEVTIAGGAGVAPGNSVGILTTGPQTWNGGALLEVEVAETNGPAGSSWDLLAVNGAVTLDGSVSSGNPVQVILSAPPIDFDARQSASWLMVDASSVTGGFSADKFAVDASAFAANNPLEGGTFSISESGGNLYLDFHTALETWRFQQFGTYSNAGDAADGANPDEDARDNLLEYGTGSDPNVFDSNSVATVGATPDGTRLTITFDRISAPALTYWVEANTNLVDGGWDPIWSSTGASNTAGTVTVEDAELISSYWQRYLRMKLMY